MEILLDEIDVLRFEKLLLQQQVLQIQAAQLEAEKNRLWADVEQRYNAKGYRLDLVGRRLIEEER